ncbi:MAG: VWA domain-containing protein [Gammaproteobacteria bacterium]|nr:VWA domain-containing protein [Gammaproteobacteria bacterium]
MNIADFHFLRPLWLLAIIPFAIFIYLYVHRKLKHGVWSDICDPQLLDWLLVDKPVRKQRNQTIWVSLGGLLAILSLAGPTWERVPAPMFRNQSALVIVLDLSTSMYATDIKPNRITRARFKITDILKHRVDGQTALITFAGDAFVVTPLTNDVDTIIHQLSVLEPNLMPAQGNDTRAAMELANELFIQAGVQKGQVLLITDGGDSQSNSIEAATYLNEKKHHLFVLGVGTEDGAPIAQAGGFVKDADGSILIPKLNQAILNKMAASGNGLYRLMISDNSDIEQLTKAIELSSQSDISKQSVSEISLWKDQGPWLVLLLIPIAALAFRHGSIAVVVISLIIFSPDSLALSWDSLWRNSNQRAQSAFDDQRFDQAAQLYQSPQWKAAALYRAGQFDQAASILQDLPASAENLYNLGNAQAQQQKLQDALASYQKVLEINPDHQDARHNKDIVEQALKQQQQQNQDNQQDNQDQQSQQSDNQQQGQQNNDQQQSQTQQQDNQHQTDSDQKNDESQQQAQPDQQQSESDTDESADQNQQQQMQSDEQEQDETSDQDQFGQSKPDLFEEEHEQLPEEEQVQSKQYNPQNQPLDEVDQATEQWMRRIPDDPGGLLRRKFLYQYKRNNKLKNRPNR